jgi:hypothetical protein
MSKQRHDPHSGHDHIEGQHGEKTNASIAKQQRKEEKRTPKQAGAPKNRDSRPEEPQKEDHG